MHARPSFRKRSLACCCTCMQADTHNYKHKRMCTPILMGPGFLCAWLMSPCCICAHPFQNARTAAHTPCCIDFSAHQACLLLAYPLLFALTTHTPCCPTACLRIPCSLHIPCSLPSPLTHLAVLFALTTLTSNLCLCVCPHHSHILLSHSLLAHFLLFACPLLFTLTTHALLSSLPSPLTHLAVPQPGC